MQMSSWNHDRVACGNEFKAKFRSQVYNFSDLLNLTYHFRLKGMLRLEGLESAWRVKDFRAQTFNH